MGSSLTSDSNSTCSLNCCTYRIHFVVAQMNRDSKCPSTDSGSCKVRKALGKRYHPLLDIYPRSKKAGNLAPALHLNKFGCGGCI
jgi:hypothetical protein